ncbi:hypothetical protein BGZ99_005352 [Dissophora globulifera]|uniref:G domain-containing protein n=1 Tax=Dissophora globulifera TaxID=979702 RepID=A0A9P6UTJ0_9FUNG|nr:hypothetical protein BGZ99_005352 [Dissophora globulifera]
MSATEIFLDSPPINNKNIILVGKTGTGKSSVANMLVQGDMYHDNVREVSDRASGMTTSVIKVAGRGWTVTDTVGLGESETGGTVVTKDALQLLENVLKASIQGFHYVGFVVNKNKGRVSTKDHLSLFRMFETIFAGAEDNFVLIFTGCEDERWLAKNKEVIQATFGHTIRTVCCDFQFDKFNPGKHSDDRKDSLVRFVQALCSLDTVSIQPNLCREDTATLAVQQRFEREVSKFMGMSIMLDRISEIPIGATEFNVLVLGETQSGKTTFVEAVRKYADQSATINEGAIGTGYGSHTTHVQTTSVTTDLPDYFVTKSMAKGIVAHQQTVVDYGEFICNQDEDDYEESLNRRRDLRMVRGPAKEHTLRFNFIDTPGLNSTTSEDELHVQGIFSELLEANSIHLVLITISSFGLFSQGLKDAIKCYLDMFPDFNGVIAFVHTRVDYKNLHPNCEKYAKALNRKMDALHEIMGRTTFPHFQIDCDLHTNKPIRDCITQSTIQKILQLAPFNKPVLMRQTAINKTQKMRDVDNLLKDKYNSTSMVIESTLRFKNQEEGDLLADIFQLETRIHKMDAEAVLLDEFLHRNNVMDLDLLRLRKSSYEVPGAGIHYRMCSAIE